MTIRLKPLDEQVIVITGASSGIGLATAEEAANRGAKLVLAARSEQTLGQIVERLKAAGSQVVSVACDVAERQQVNRVADVAISTFGRIDTWVNNSGIAIYGRLDEVSEADSRRLFDTNFGESSMVLWQPCVILKTLGVPSSTSAARPRKT